MKRDHQRALSLAFMASVAGYLVYLGDEWLIDGFPAHYLGYILAAVVLLGSVGVNVWFGGPLDKRSDPMPTGSQPKSD